MKLLFRMTPAGAYYSGSDFLSSYHCPFARSDTVFQAVTNAWEALWGKQERDRLLEAFQNEQQPPFYLSSIFPAVGAVYFLPRPVAFKIESPGKSKSFATTSTQVSWVSAAIYQNWLEGQELIWNADNFLPPGLYLHSKEMEKSEAFPRPLWSRSRRMRNIVDIATSNAQVYPANQIFYADTLDFYLLVHLADEEYRNKLTAVFRLLGDEGIGGKRSIGCGSYHLHKEITLPPELDFIDAPIGEEDAFVTISLYHPHADDIGKGLLRHGDFEWVARQGWRSDSHGTSVRTRMVNLLSEGSYFHFPKLVAGGLLDVSPQPNTQFFHYGFPFRVKAPVLANSAKAAVDDSM